jgi:DNA-binding response OmpR family regulator
MDASPRRVLVIEDDSNVRELLSLHLGQSGFKVTEVGDGIRGLELALTNSYDLIILDIALPGRDGIEVCRALRAKEISAAVMMLTSRGDEVDKILGFELGADDYVTKPFSVREVVVRAKALVRRTQSEPLAKDKSLTSGDVEIDPDSREVLVRGVRVELTSTEFDLLFFFVKNAGRAFSREQLLTAVWGYSSSAYEHTVNTHINRLRSKIERDPSEPIMIQTVWGVGYKFVGRSDVGALAA